jgi:hypothetical protein
MGIADGGLFAHLKMAVSISVFRLNLDLSCIVAHDELICERMMAWVSKEES